MDVSTSTDGGTTWKLNPVGASIPVDDRECGLECRRMGLNLHRCVRGWRILHGNRDLFDDFGVAASPATGMASIIYSDDQYTNDANNPPQAGCTPARSNTGACDHTAVATQTSGPGIYTVVR